MELLENNIYNQEILSNYLKEVDEDFGIPLSSKISLEEYSSKLLNNGYVLSVLEDGKMHAMIGIYANDKVNLKSFISILSSHKNFRGKGYARKLVEEAITLCRGKGMESLFVDSVNPIAVSLYSSLGFSIYKTEQIEDKVKTYLIKSL